MKAHFHQMYLFELCFLYPFYLIYTFFPQIFGVEWNREYLIFSFDKQFYTFIVEIFRT